MRAAEILARLEDRGVSLRAEGGRLRYRAQGRLAPELRALIRDHRDELLAALGDAAPDDRAPREVLKELIEVLRENWEERAAIYEYEGRFSRVEAECKALEHVRAALEAFHHRA